MLLTGALLTLQQTPALITCSRSVLDDDAMQSLSGVSWRNIMLQGLYKLLAGVQ
jgi:hypothetical protein